MHFNWKPKLQHIIKMLIKINRFYWNSYLLIRNNGYLKNNSEVHFHAAKYEQFCIWFCVTIKSIVSSLCQPFSNGEFFLVRSYSAPHEILEKKLIMIIFVNKESTQWMISCFVFLNRLHFEWIQCDKKNKTELIGGAIWMCSTEVCVLTTFYSLFRDCVHFD